MYEINWLKYVSKIVIHLSNGEKLTYSGGDKIINTSYKASLSDSSKEPLGKVSCNTITTKIVDAEEYFVLSNENSPYYKLFGDGTRVEYFITVDGVEKQRGMYFITDVKNSTGTNNISTVEFTCADRLRYVLSTPIVSGPAISDISVYQFLTELFRGIGLGAEIDEELQRIWLPYGFLVGSTYKDVLNMLCQSYNLVIYTDDRGLINVKLLSSFSKAEVVYEFDGTTGTLFKTTNNVDMLTTYTDCLVNYIAPTEVKGTKLLSVDKLHCEPGQAETDWYKYSDLRALSVDYVSLISDDGSCKLLGFESSQDGIRLQISNTSDEAKDVNFAVYGKAVIQNKVTVQSYMGADETKRKYKTVDTEYIQTQEDALNLIDHVVRMLNTDMCFISVVGKGHPHLSIGDCVSVKSDLLKINGEFIVNEISMSVGASYTFNASLINIDALA